MDVRHSEIKDSAEQIGGGGVSIFYCHTLQLLFFSYVQGKSFMAPLKAVSEELKDVFRIEVSFTQGFTESILAVNRGGIGAKFTSP